MEIVFGPVPSRRLGRSLGVNNIPPKHCSYSCLYCQVGSTRSQEMLLRDFYPPKMVLQQVSQRLEAVRGQAEAVDYLTFVPDGEPTLDRQLAATIETLRPLGLPIAIISNASLIWQPEVRETLRHADWVSLKVDSVDTATWRKINRPHPDLKLPDILDGIRDFARSYSGILVSETMLLDGINDSAESLASIAGFLAACSIKRHYLSIPHRPPAVSTARIPSEAAATRAYQIFCEMGLDTELLTVYEGDAIAYSGDLRQDILATVSVHPLRESALRVLLEKSGENMAQIAALLAAGELKTVEYAGETFYVRRLSQQ